MRITDETLRRISASRPFCGLPGYRGRGFRDRITRSVTGEIDDAVLASTRNAIGSGQIRMDAVSAALLSHHGINPAVAAMTGMIAQTAEFDEAEARCVVTDRSVLAPLTLRYAGLWISSRLRIEGLQRLPQSVVIGAEGRPLRDLVSHPALDPLQLTVLAVGVDPVETRIAIDDPGDADLSTYLPAGS